MERSGSTFVAFHKDKYRRNREVHDFILSKNRDKYRINGEITSFVCFSQSFINFDDCIALHCGFVITNLIIYASETLSWKCWLICVSVYFGYFARRYYKRSYACEIFQTEKRKKRKTLQRFFCVATEQFSRLRCFSNRKQVLLAF